MSSPATLARSQERKPHSTPASKPAPVRRQANRAPDIRAAGNLSVQRLSLQRCGGHKCPASGCSPARKAMIEGHSNDDPLEAIPPAVFRVLKSSGHPIDGRTRAVMESVFGHDLGDIRIHSDSQAASSADAVGALAYTVGSDVVLGRGYRDRSVAGAGLLAHELTHALQQRGRSSGGAALAIDDNPTLEAEADRWADNVRLALATSPEVGAGTTTQPAGHRCPHGQACSPDDLARHQGSGTTTCDKTTGRMNINVTEHCAGNCVAQHEAVHAADDQECCTRVAACLSGAAGDAAKEAACRSAYNTWYPTNSDYTECRAYTTEVGCLTSFIAAHCEGGRAATGAFIGGIIGGPIGAGVGAAIGSALTESVSEACCNTLRSELTFAQAQATSHCPGVNNPCPIRADGSII